MKEVSTFYKSIRLINRKISSAFIKINIMYRHAARIKNPGGQVVLGGDNVSPLVEIGLTDPPKSGGAAAPPASHLAACLHTRINKSTSFYRVILKS